MGNGKKCVDIGDLGGSGGEAPQSIAQQAVFWGRGDVRKQFVQGICILHGQSKAKK
jgi:hypothetical protein